MANFPRLKTAAVAQYPAIKTVAFRNQVLRFLDGQEQRYRDSAGALHRWEIRLNELDESEMATLDAFFAANEGRLGNFAFTDPWDGTEYANCSLESDQMQATSSGEMRGATVLTVTENRN